MTLPRRLQFQPKTGGKRRKKVRGIGVCFRIDILALIVLLLSENMAATVEISVPDTLLKAIGAEPAELPRQTLEALIVQAFRKGQITHAQVGELLELNRFETDAFLKSAQAFRLCESEEFVSDLESLRRISNK